MFGYSSQDVAIRIGLLRTISCYEYSCCFRKPLPLYKIFKIVKKTKYQMQLEEIFRLYPKTHKDVVNAALLLANNDVDQAKTLLKIHASQEHKKKNYFRNPDEPVPEPLNLKKELPASVPENKNNPSNEKIKILSNTLISPSKNLSSVKTSSNKFESSDHTKENTVPNNSVAKDLDNIITNKKSDVISPNEKLKNSIDTKENTSSDLCIDTDSNNIKSNQKVLNVTRSATKPDINDNKKDTLATEVVTANLSDNSTKLHDYKKECKEVMSSNNLTTIDKNFNIISPENFLKMQQNSENISEVQTNNDKDVFKKPVLNNYTRSRRGRQKTQIPRNNRRYNDTYLNTYNNPFLSTHNNYQANLHSILRENYAQVATNTNTDNNYSDLTLQANAITEIHRMNQQQKEDILRNNTYNTQKRPNVNNLPNIPEGAQTSQASKTSPSTECPPHSSINTMFCDYQRSQLDLQRSNRIFKEKPPERHLNSNNNSIPVLTPPNMLTYPINNQIPFEHSIPRERQCEPTRLRENINTWLNTNPMMRTHQYVDDMSRNMSNGGCQNLGQWCVNQGLYPNLPQSANPVLNGAPPRIYDNQQMVPSISNTNLVPNSKQIFNIPNNENLPYVRTSSQTKRKYNTSNSKSLKAQFSAIPSKGEYLSTMPARVADTPNTLPQSNFVDQSWPVTSRDQNFHNMYNHENFGGANIQYRYLQEAAKVPLSSNKRPVSETSNVTLGPKIPENQMQILPHPPLAATNRNGSTDNANFTLPTTLQQPVSASETELPLDPSTNDLKNSSTYNKMCSNKQNINYEEAKLVATLDKNGKDPTTFQSVRPAHDESVPTVSNDLQEIRSLQTYMTPICEINGEEAILFAHKKNLSIPNNLESPKSPQTYNNKQTENLTEPNYINKKGQLMPENLALNTPNNLSQNTTLSTSNFNLINNRDNEGNKSDQILYKTTKLADPICLQKTVNGAKENMPVNSHNNLDVRQTSHLSEQVNKNDETKLTSGLRNSLNSTVTSTPLRNLPEPEENKLVYATKHAEQTNGQADYLPVHVTNNLEQNKLLPAHSVEKILSLPTHNNNYQKINLITTHHNNADLTAGPLQQKLATPATPIYSSNNLVQNDLPTTNNITHEVNFPVYNNNISSQTVPVENLPNNNLKQVADQPVLNVTIAENRIVPAVTHNVKPVELTNLQRTVPPRAETLLPHESNSLREMEQLPICNESTKLKEKGFLPDQAYNIKKNSLPDVPDSVKESKFLSVHTINSKEELSLTLKSSENIRDIFSHNVVNPKISTVMKNDVSSQHISSIPTTNPCHQQKLMAENGTTDILTDLSNSYKITISTPFPSENGITYCLKQKIIYSSIITFLPYDEVIAELLKASQYPNKDFREKMHQIEQAFKLWIFQYMLRGQMHKWIQMIEKDYMTSFRNFCNYQNKIRNKLQDPQYLHIAENGHEIYLSEVDNRSNMLYLQNVNNLCESCSDATVSGQNYIDQNLTNDLQNEVICHVNATVEVTNTDNQTEIDQNNIVGIANASQECNLLQNNDNSNIPEQTQNESSLSSTSEDPVIQDLSILGVTNFSESESEEAISIREHRSSKSQKRKHKRVNVQSSDSSDEDDNVSAPKSLKMLITKENNEYVSKFL